MKSSANIDISNYSFHELKKCIGPFQEYKKGYGDAPPINTGFSLVDDVGNWSASWFGVKTLQNENKQILDILNSVEKKHEEQSWAGEPLVVFLTLEKIKKIYDQIIESGIKKGKTIDALTNLFWNFNFPYKETGEQYEEISKRILHQVRDLRSVPAKQEPEASVSSSLTS